MKKLLSLLLAIAIVISCVSMVTFNASAEEATAPSAHDALKLKTTANNQNIANNLLSGGLLDADSSYNGSKTLVFAVKNIGEKASRPNMKIFARFAHSKKTDGSPSWEVPSGITATNNTSEISPGQTKIMTFTISGIENGTVTHTCYNAACKEENETCTANKVSINALWLRFDSFTVATTILVTCIKSYDGETPSKDYKRVNEYLTGTYAGYEDSNTVFYDSAVFESRKGIQFTLTETVNATTATYARVNAGFTKDMVVDGMITTSYDIYNTSDHMVSFNIQYQHGNQDPEKDANTGHSYTKWIEPNKKVTVTAKIAVKETAEGKYVVEYYDSPMKDTPLTAELSAIYLRYQFDAEAKYNTKGSSVIVVPTSIDDRIYLKQDGTLPDGVEVTSIPDYEEQKTDPDPVIGIKLSAKSDYFGKKDTLYNLYSAGYQNDPSFTGTLAATYSIYNPTDKQIKVDAYFQIGGNNGWGAKGANPVHDIITIQPECKKDFKISVDVEKGLITATINNSKISKPLSQLLVRFDVTIPNDVGVAEGDYIVIEPIGDTPNINNSYYDRGHYSVSSVPVENKIEGADLEIGSSLTVNYSATVHDGITNPVLRVTRGNDVREIPGEFENGMYKFAYTGVNAQCMADNIKAELIYNDEVLDIKDNYSVKQYAINLYNDTENPASDELKALLTDMLHYGAEVQKYIGYKIDNLATKGTEGWTPSKYDKPEGVKTATQNDKDNNKVIAVGLNISNVNKIYFRVDLKDKVTFSLTRNGKNAVFVTDGDLIYTEAINATGFDDEFVLTITKDGKVISTVSYNVNAYINSKFDSEKLGNIIPALNNYGMSAQAYIDSLNQQ